MANFGNPIFLDKGCLPTKSAVFNHSLALRKKLESGGVWRHNTPISEIVKAVSDDVKEQWAKTSIPNYFDTDQEKADKRILDVLKQGKMFLKTPVTRRAENFASEMFTLLDMSVCKHEQLENCICPEYHKVNNANKLVDTIFKILPTLLFLMLAIMMSTKVSSVLYMFQLTVSQ